MKSKNALTLLTLATASLLSACGSGGKAPQAMLAPLPNKPQAEQPQEEKKQPQQPEKPQTEKDKLPPTPKPDVPQPPAPRPKLEEKFEDKKVFERLSLYSARGGVVSDNLFKMKLNDGNRKIELEIIPPNTLRDSSKIETLRDIDGTLIGYYGYAGVNQRIKKGTDGELAVVRDFFIYDSDSHHAQRPVGTGNINYQGKMFYQYDNDPNGAKEAKVSAVYSVEKKQMSMNIVSERDGAWTLHKDKSHKSDVWVDVDEGGSVAGRLVFTGNQDSTLRPNGVFTGGFYGKNGSVLSGKAQFEGDSRERNGWQGVIGATAVPSK